MIQRLYYPTYIGDIIIHDLERPWKTNQHNGMTVLNSAHQKLLFKSSRNTGISSVKKQLKSGDSNTVVDFWSPKSSRSQQMGIRAANDPFGAIVCFKSWAPGCDMRHATSPRLCYDPWKKADIIGNNPDQQRIRAYLVVWNIFFKLNFHILGISSSQLTKSYSSVG